MFSNFSALLPLLQLFSHSHAEDQRVLKDEGASPFNKAFAKLANETLDMWYVPGVSIAVVDGDNIWAEGYGIATFPNTPVTPSTLFSCGSTTKAFVAAAMSLFVDDNQTFSHIEWDTPISDLIRDDFVLENDYATTHITIEDALSHRSGMPRHDLSYGGHIDGHKFMPKDLVRSLRHLPLTAEPRTHFQYCNLMYVVVSHVIETLSGKWLGDFLKERIWTPLNMHSTYFNVNDAKAAPEYFATGYNYHNEKFEEVPDLDFDSISGAGSVISNVLDYSKWVRALLNSFPSGPVSKSGFDALKTSRTIIPRGDEDIFPYTGTYGYSLGWMTGVYKGHEFFEHGGGMAAYGAEVIFFPALNYGLVALGNTAATSNFVENRLIWHLIDEKLGVPEEERFDWNKKNQAAKDRLIERNKNAKNKFYPDIPNPPIPHTLPLENYTGTYYNPGYRNVTIFEKDRALHINRQDATLKVKLDLEHVSGDYFMAYIDSTLAPGLVFKDATPAEFVVGGDGMSKSFGIATQPEMAEGARIHFTRI